MRHSIVAIMRGDSKQVHKLSEVSFQYHMHKYSAVRKHGDGLTPYKAPYNFTAPPAVYRIPESHPFFNIAIFGRTSDFSLYAEVIKRRSIRPILEDLVAQFS